MELTEKIVDKLSDESKVFSKKIQLINTDMAGAKVLDDIDEKFCQCCVCFEQYKEPRQLPCLHRYCTECLEKMINKDRKDFKCPLCQEEIIIPENGVEGFKKDFYMNEILDYIQLKMSLKDDQVHICGDCSKQTKSSAYCFKCTDFLCSDCHEYHVTRKSLQEHRSHILSIEDVETKNITLEKFSILKEAPRCQTHPQNLSQLCCKTCANRPVCLTCTYGKHKDHDMHDIIEFATSEREKLKQQLKVLHDGKERTYERLTQMKSIEEEIVVNANKMLHLYEANYNTEVDQLKSKREHFRKQMTIEENEIQRNLEEQISLEQKEVEDKIKQIRNQFEATEAMYCKQAGLKLQDSKKHLELYESRSTERFKRLQEDWETVCTKVSSEKNKKLTKRGEMVSEINSTIKKFENITETTKNILSSQDDWAAAHNTDDIIRATKPLIQDMKREHPEVEQLAIYAIEQMGEKNLIMLVEEVITIKDILSKKYDVRCIACADDVIVMIGFTGTTQVFHITVIDMNGKVIRWRNLRHDNTFGNFECYCYCAHLKEFTVVVINTVGRITLYDLRHGGSGLTQQLCDVISEWSISQKLVTCIATDNVRSRIIVGTNESRNLYVLDDELNYCETLKLPEIIKWPGDIAVHEKKIFVCDTEGMSACAVSMRGALLHEFDKPGANNYNIPVSVCVTTDNYQSIYILWRDKRDNIKPNSVIVKYDQDDYNINLESLPFCSDGKSLSLRSAEHCKTQKLVITQNYLPKKIYVYGKLV